MSTAVADHPFSASIAQASAWVQPEWLGAWRQAGVSQFQAHGFPHTRMESYRFTDLTALRTTELSLVAPGSAEDADLSLADIPNLDAARMVFVDGRYSAKLSCLDGIGEQVRIQSIAQAITDGADGVEAALNADGLPDDLPFAALNQGLFTDGAWIQVPRQVSAPLPIHLIFLATTKAAGGIIATRNVISLEEGASATVIESYCGPDDVAYLNLPVTLLQLEQAADLDHYKLLSEGNSGFHLAAHSATQGRDSVCSSHGFTNGGLIARNDIHIGLNGSGCASTLNGLYLGKDRQLIDNHTVIAHREPHCESFQVYKGILDDKAHGVFNGRIHVHQAAQKTNALQTNRALLMSKRAHLNTKPELLIFADDVKCTHGATIGQLDEDAMYYLRTRGIPESQARAMLTCAFGGEAIDDMKVEAIRDAVTAQMLENLRDLEAMI